MIDFEFWVFEGMCIGVNIISVYRVYKFKKLKMTTYHIVTMACLIKKPVIITVRGLNA